jgi:hypothetical protein
MVINYERRKELVAGLGGQPCEISHYTINKPLVLVRRFILANDCAKGMFCSFDILEMSLCNSPTG